VCDAEYCTLRLDDRVDDLLPELTEMAVLADPNGPLENTVWAKRAITLRDLLVCILGIGVIDAEPGTIPIADALDALGQPSSDEWIRRLGMLPLAHQPGERWMYDTAANVTGVLISRATGRSLGDALSERILRSARNERHRLQCAARKHRTVRDGVRTRRTHLGPSVGSYGWPGFYGTAWYNDPAEDLTAIFVMQRAHAGDQTLPM
jgi:CubicO group peptidase (beta-lactamase class C family)